ncbi:sigma 54-interacting transcriptional regulator [Desulfovibrio sp.]|uniref:sigma-54 interaction domain-containing protein n=1 Tax=Desulfovibrio sp. TaxID=885 RepID=UPI003076EAB8
MFNSRQFYNVNRASVLTPQVRAIWDNMCIGVAVVDADGICEYMNPIQRRADGFTRIPVEGQHITSLYVPHEREVIPTMECLQTGKPLLKKAYWYATSTNFLISTVADFFPLFDHGRKDGVITFAIWTGNTAHFSESRRPLKPCNADTPYSYYTFSSIVGRDEALQECIHEARSAATSSSPVMIWGESGTGKELFAQAIHSASSRAGHPFIPVNCAAIPENLLEGILFGTVKGAYTDAPDKPGLFEKANCGTLLFDELNSMSLGLQAKLLRVIQEKRVRRLGSHTEIPINVRIISILNEHPLRAVDQGLLRRDLFYRLAVVGIAVPPLRKRQNDIPLLVRHIINRLELAMKTAGVTLDDEVMGIFRRYPWPGNIRELAHVIEGSLALLDGSDIITVHNLPRHFREACNLQPADDDLRPPLPNMMRAEPQMPVSAATTPDYFDYRGIRRGDSVSIKTCLHEYESSCIRNVLRVTGGNVAKAARIMELTPAGLHYRMKVLHIENED